MCYRCDGTRCSETHNWSWREDKSCREREVMTAADTDTQVLMFHSITKLLEENTYAVSMPNVSAVNHFIHRAHCSSTSPSCLPLSSSPDPVRASAASEPSPAVSCHTGKQLIISTKTMECVKWKKQVSYTQKQRHVIMSNYVTIPSLPFEDSVSMLMGSSPNAASLKVHRKIIQMLKYLTTYISQCPRCHTSCQREQWTRIIKLHWSYII